MSLLFMDGFDHYTSLGDKGWGGTGSGGNIGASIVTSGGQFGGSYMMVNEGNGGGYYAYKTLGGNFPGLIVGVAVLDAGYPSTYGALFSIRDGGTIQMEIRDDNLGRLLLMRGGTTLATSTNSIFSTSQYTYVELKVSFATGATGSYSVRANGQPIAGIPDTTNIQTSASGNTYGNLLACGGSGTINHNSIRYDDIYVCDMTGTLNNDLLGAVRISTLFPTGPGTYSQFPTQVGGTTGQPYTAVNETTPNGDTSYISSSTVGDKHTFTTTTIAASATVYGVQTNLYAKRDDAGKRFIAPYIVNGASEGQVGTGLALTPGYLSIRQLTETDPTTGAQWVGSNVNASEFGIRIVS